VHQRPEKLKEFLVAKNLPKNDFQKSSKVADFQQENRPDQNPEFLATPLCHIFTRIAAVPDPVPTKMRAVPTTGAVNEG
jgi:hypothetical protein